ncbi:YolD-like family protein [Bacillus sp. EB01]|uniref:YolD-like family protein n=1 Tax=Bacillus sp. EB01 TaxID=1347086 RepID=UPI0005C59E08|nr:YolD-like family protein [Bacillus sp. EB01]
MGIRDRGKMKWRSAFFMPEQSKLMREARLEDSKVAKPILDEQEWEEIEQNILLAMEYASPVRIKIWNDGFFIEYEGMLHTIDELKKVLYLETADLKMKQIGFLELIDVTIVV